MKSLGKRLFLLFASIVFAVNYGMTQCAMCKATVENNGEIGETDYGYNINLGIIFLMTIPYIILFIAFRKKIFAMIRQIKSAKH